MRTMRLAVVTGLMAGCAPSVVADQSADPGTVSVDSTLDQGDLASADDTDDGAASEGSGESGLPDDAPDLGPVPTLERMAPLDGTTAGGQFVVLHGTDLAAVTAVRICGAPATLDSVDDTRITAWTPEGVSGACDVVVENDAGEAVLDEDWMYWDDASGRTVAAASWTTAVFANPAHWGGPVVDEIRAHMAVVPAQELVLSDLYAVGTDTCVRTDGESREDGWSAFSGIDSGAAGILLDGEETELGFVHDMGIYHETFGIELLPGGAVELGIIADANALSPALLVETEAALPAELQVTVPDVHGAAPPAVSSRAYDVAWTGSGSGYVGIDLWDLQSERRLRCVAADDGAFTVPAELLADFGSTWTQLLVTRYAVDAVEVPHNRGLVQVQVGRGVVGAVWMSR